MSEAEEWGDDSCGTLFGRRLLLLAIALSLFIIDATVYTSLRSKKGKQTLGFSYSLPLSLSEKEITTTHCTNTTR